MPAKHYDWKRFWCPRDGRLSLADGGFLADPDDDLGAMIEGDVVPFEAISPFPCLVLLGEPGIGKSTVLKSMFEEATPAIAQAGDVPRYFDLCSYGSEDRLVRELFEKPEIGQWTKGDHRLHLYIDSLDEALLRIDTVAAILATELPKLPVSRLVLRITCRTAVWPRQLEKALERLPFSQQKEKSVGVFELAPLRRQDAASAAAANGIDADEFITAAQSQDAVPFAVKPITLDFLINTYRKSESFPKTKWELCRAGCLCLCEEMNANRQASRRVGKLDAEMRLAVAARIAAVTTLSKRAAVWIDADRGDVPDHDVTIQSLCGGQEAGGTGPFNVDRDAILETLDTGLFSSRGPNRLGWAHQSYPEFLAASYLVRSKVTPGQVMSLITDQHDPERSVVPQLQETAAWLSCMQKDVFQAIVEREPEILLLGDLGAYDDSQRACLVERLLERLARAEIFDSDLRSSLKLRGLAHPNITQQLAPYIADKQAHIFVRRGAMDIARARQLSELYPGIASVALDASDEYHVRGYAASVISGADDEELKARMKPLALGQAGEDPDDELKGSGLMAVWPDHINSDELFPLLVPQAKKNLFGCYWMFLRYHLIKHIRPHDFPAALAWVESQGTECTLTIREVISDIMLKAYESLDRPGVLPAFASAAMSRLKNPEPILPDGAGQAQFEPFLRDIPKRRRLLDELVKMSVGCSDKILLASVLQPGLVSYPDDIPWMVERLQLAEEAPVREAWAEVIRDTYDNKCPCHVGLIIEACGLHPELNERFSSMLSPVDFASRDAEKQKASWDRLNKAQARQDTPPVLDPPPEKRVAFLLEALESDEIEAWPELVKRLTLKPTSTHDGEYLRLDITEHPGWRNADDQTRTRVLAAARKFVDGHVPAPLGSLPPGSTRVAARPGYGALRLLALCQRDVLEDLAEQTWRTWAALSVAMPQWLCWDAPDDLHLAILELAHQKAPRETYDAVLKAVVAFGKKEIHKGFYRGVLHVADEALINALVTEAGQIDSAPESLGNLLTVLQERGWPEAETLAEGFVTQLRPYPEEKQQHAVQAALALVREQEDAGWDVVWPAIQEDPDFGQNLIRNLSSDRGPRLGGRPFYAKLTAQQASDLYLWITERYPHCEEDFADGSFGFASFRDLVSELRDEIFRHLKGRGTAECYNAIRRIVAALPDVEWLKYEAITARRIMLRKTWCPPDPAVIIQTAQDSGLRFVQDGSALLDVVIESLKRLECKLHAETPAIRDLWDEVPRKKTYRPVDENAFSDYVKRHLQDDIGGAGIVVSREVRIHRGQATDIHIDAVRRSTDGVDADIVTAIVEVKGCWHRHVWAAMKNQLVDMYLTDNQCRHGLYLVGWFSCEQWDEDDSRRRRCTRLTAQQARTKLDRCAAGLRSGSLDARAFVMDIGLR
ncbi:MAG: hypothetical protein JXR94_08415 [Candidatus Hydrogenedentes bacterium]|nr:hypothetical protein [Candidatus Hydrogenedentota bacterium]